MSKALQSKRTVLVTGATGFVGSILCRNLARSGYIVRAGLRSARQVPSHIGETVVTGDIDGKTDFTAAVEGVDAIVHLAARVHVMNDSAQNEALYAQSNAYGSRQLAMAAARAGVSRLVYLSSIKVNGEKSVGVGFTAADPPAPVDAYGRSKWLAEQLLAEIADRSSLQLAVVRSPLVYGPGVRANFLRLMRWIDRGVPLPFGGIDNRRSLVNVWNLCDLLENLLDNPRGTDRAWLVSDPEQLSTPSLVRRLAAAMNRRAILLPVPPAWLRMLGTMAGKQAEIDRLCGSLVVEPMNCFTGLGWTAPVPVDEALRRTAEWYSNGVAGDAR